MPLCPRASLWFQHRDLEQAEELAELAQREAETAHDHLRKASADEAWAQAVVHRDPNAAREAAERSLSVYHKFNANGPRLAVLNYLLVSR